MLSRPNVLVTANPGNDFSHILVLQLNGKVLEHLGRLDEAASCFRRAADISQSCGYKAGVAECHHRLGVVLTQLGRPTAAEQSLRVAVDLYGILGYTEEAAQAADDLNDLITGAELLSGLDQQTATPA